MSQFDPPDQPSGTYLDPNAAYAEPPRTSALAIVSLVCSLIFCCPLTTLLGPLLGLIAIAMIGGNPARKGKGLAVVAILIGAMLTAGWAGMIYIGYTRLHLPTQVGPLPEIQALQDGDYDSFRGSTFGGLAAMSDDELRAFAEEIESRYGRLTNSYFDEAEFAANMPSMQELMSPIKTYPYVFEFEKGTISGEAEFGTGDPASGQLEFSIRWGRIKLFDESLGDLEIPVRPDSTSEADGGTIDPPPGTDDPPEDDGSVDSGGP